jgi:hypothetical protein
MSERLADLLTGLSRVADLGFGLEAGTAQRSSVLATLLACSLDLPDGDVRAAYCTALLHRIGCVGYAHETAKLFHDELSQTGPPVGWIRDPLAMSWSPSCRS